MKFKELNKEESFKPFDIVITVETEEELKELFHRFNFFLGYGKTMYPKGYYTWKGEEVSFDSYRFFDKLLANRNLRP